MRSPNSPLDNKFPTAHHSSALDSYPIQRDYTTPGTMHKQNIFDVIDINDDDDDDDERYLADMAGNMVNNDSLRAANLLLLHH
jgi:hypothetical protein